MTVITVATSRVDLEIVTMIVMVTAVDRIAMVTKTATTTEDTTEMEKSFVRFVMATLVETILSNGC